MSEIDSALKEKARLFLEAMQSALNKSLPPPDQLRTMVRQIAAASKTDPASAHLRLPERVFLNRFVVPTTFFLMQKLDGIEIDGKKARRAFLCEGYANADLSKYCSGTPARTEQHPFTKIIAPNPDEIVRKWRSSNSPLTKACPDFAFRDPFPYKILFETKYFERGSFEKAARDLATDIYQAFFYRALPYVEPKRSGVAWDYDFACLLACDVSPNAALLTAWDELAEPVKAGFWQGANVYVMILRPLAH